ncbi:hypothetical protein BSKO_05533 [Bryopsis sp. KO-2023]|nr:hypothetical protein BSKO_05533 [Bryopsis sp. KO-2023]
MCSWAHCILDPMLPGFKMRASTRTSPYQAQVFEVPSITRFEKNRSPAAYGRIMSGEAPPLMVEMSKGKSHSLISPKPQRGERLQGVQRNVLFPSDCGIRGEMHPL